MAKKSNISKETLKELVELGMDAIKAAADNMSKVLKFDPPIDTTKEVTAKGAAGTNQAKKIMKEICDEIFDIVMDDEKDDQGLLLVNPDDVAQFDKETNDLIMLVCPERVKMLYGSKDKPANTPGRGTAKQFRSTEATKARKKMIYDLITEGKYTRKQIIEKVMETFPEVTASTLGTFLTDCKNPNYNKFDKLAVQGKDKIYSFNAS